MANREKLEEAGVVTPGHDFAEGDVETLESLSDEEVQQLCDLKDKLGSEFLERHGNPGHGLMF